MDAQRRARQTFEHDERRRRDNKQQFASREGKKSIATAMIKHLRYEIPKVMMQELMDEGENHYARTMHFHDIWICPTELQEWHIPRNIIPDKDEIFAAMMQSVCKDGNRRFQWRWTEPTRNYTDGARMWQYCLTDMQKCPAKTHDGYETIWKWIHANPANRGSFEDLTSMPHTRDLQVCRWIIHIS